MHSFRVAQADYDIQMYEFSSFIKGGSGLAQEFTATSTATLESLVLFLFEPSGDVACEQQITLYDLDAGQSLESWSVDVAPGIGQPPLVLSPDTGTITLVKDTRYQIRVVACPDTDLLQMRRLGWVHNVTELYADSAVESTDDGTTWTPLPAGLPPHTTHFEVCI